MQKKLIIPLAELAEILALKPKSLSNKLSASPESLPPVVSIPGLRQPYFRLQDVESWINAHVVNVQPRRGRPTKAEQRRRQEVIAVK